MGAEIAVGDRVPDEAACAAVRDLDGNEHRLDELWAKGTTVLVFLRHFGWMFCREQAVQLHRERAEIEKRGARLTFVGNGNRHSAQGFRDQFEITSAIYVDTSRASYAALGFRSSGLGPRAMLTTARAGVRALGGGFMQGRIQGDAFQLGGVVAVDTGGVVRYRYVSSAAGDHPAAADVIAALAG